MGPAVPLAAPRRPQHRAGALRWVQRLIALWLAPAALAAPEGGWAGVAAPLVSYDSNLLLGVGAFGQVVRGDPDGTRPFLFNVSLQLYATLGGYQDHFLAWDLPGVGRSPLRFMGRVRYQRWTRARYFGLGNDTLLPADPDAYLWESVRPNVWMALRIDLGETDWQVYGSGSIAAQQVGVLPDTILQAEQPVGTDGGLLSLGTIGLFLDTRDSEIHPTVGHTLDVALFGASTAIGSDFTYGGGHLALRGFWSPGRSLVLAGHGLGEAATRGEPFFQQAQLDGISYGATGGRYLLRGLTEERLRGNGMVAAQGELRATVWRTTWFKEVDLFWMVVPFVDSAWLWTWDGPNAFAPHVTGGSGLRVDIEELLVLRVDVGAGVEHHVDEPERRPQVQVYVLADHPF